MVCDVLVLHGCLFLLSILSLLLFFLVGEWGVEGEAACSQGHAFVCVFVLVVGGRRGRGREGGEGGSRQGQPRERERGGGREMSACAWVWVWVCVWVWVWVWVFVCVGV